MDAVELLIYRLTLGSIIRVTQTNACMLIDIAEIELINQDRNFWTATRTSIHRERPYCFRWHVIRSTFLQITPTRCQDQHHGTICRGVRTVHFRHAMTSTPTSASWAKPGTIPLTNLIQAYYLGARALCADRRLEASRQAVHEARHNSLTSPKSGGRRWRHQVTWSATLQPVLCSRLSSRPLPAAICRILRTIYRTAARADRKLYFVSAIQPCLWLIVGSINRVA